MRRRRKRGFELELCLSLSLSLWQLRVFGLCVCAGTQGQKWASGVADVASGEDEKRKDERTLGVSNQRSIDCSHYETERKEKRKVEENKRKIRGKIKLGK